MSNDMHCFRDDHAVYREIQNERLRQDLKWGEQNHPDGTGQRDDRWQADRARRRCEVDHGRGLGTWRHILDEEIAEAYAEHDPVKLRAELIQVAAVTAAWIEAIDRRSS